jgi:hypothetical protein
MKILFLLITTLLCCGSLSAQIEEFDGFGYSVDSTFTKENNIDIIHLTYRDSESNIKGSIIIGLREDRSVSHMASKSSKGIILYELNENEDIVYENVNHLEREFSHIYITYEYFDNGLIKEMYQYDSLKNLLGSHEFTYTSDGKNREKAYEYGANGYLKSFETYTYLESGELATKNVYNSSQQLISQYVNPAKAWNGYELYYMYTYNDDNTLASYKYAELDAEGEPQVDNEYTFQYLNGEVYSFRENTEEAKTFEGNEHYGCVKAYHFVIKHNEKIQEGF